MHIFLTGERDIGKTTIINKVSRSLSSYKLGGFITFMGEDFEPGKNYIYMSSPSSLMPKKVIALRDRVDRMAYGLQGYPEVFDTFGVGLLNDTIDSDLIIMDELGTIERESQIFQEKVFDILDGDTCVLGTLKASQDPFLERVGSKENVKVFEVNEDNRDDLPLIIIDLIKKQNDRRGGF